MASNQTFTKEVVDDLKVIPYFTDLMKASTSKDSMFIKTKQTLEALFDKGSFTQKEKAEMVAQTLGSMTTSITNAAMGTALAMAKDKRDAPYEMAKLVADTKLTQEQADKLSEDTKLIEAQKNKMTFDGWRIQADLFAKQGVNVTAENVTSPILSNVKPSNKLATDVVSAESGKASKFATLNGSFRKDGVHTVTTDANEDIVLGADATPAGWKTLTLSQIAVAIRQEQGFDDNMKQHAANSSANMIGLLLSTENSGVLTAADVERWRTAVDYLNTPVV